MGRLDVQPPPDPPDPPEPQTFTDAHIALAGHMDGWITKNQQIIDRLFRWFVVAAVAVGADIMFWLVDLLWFYETVQPGGS